MSNVPMTRPEELLALHETPYFHSSTFTELDDGRILHAAGTTFTTSDDGGITWSEPFERRDTDGAPSEVAGLRWCDCRAAAWACYRCGRTRRNRGAAFTAWSSGARRMVERPGSHLFK